MAKLKLDFSGLDKMIEDMHKMGANVKEVAESALKKSRDYINSNLESAMTPHNRSGETMKSLKDAPVEWSGTVAKIPVGFDIKNGGMPSIFLMYGTKVYGTPRVKKDTKLYSAIYGKKTKEKIKEIMSEEFRKVLKNG